MRSIIHTDKLPCIGVVGEYAWNTTVRWEDGVMRHEAVNIHSYDFGEGWLRITISPAFMPFIHGIACGDAIRCGI